MRTPLTFCSQAIKRIHHIQKTSGKTSVLIGVKGGGCNGLKYVVAPTSDAPSRLDEELTLDGVHVIVCGKSLLHLLGTAVRWEEDAMGAGLRFDNPNASATCGCGETFS